MNDLIESARTIISGIESHISNPYSAEGFYKIFTSGFLPVPYLWSQEEEFKHAKALKTRPYKGSVKIVGEDGKPLKPHKVIDFAVNNIKDAEYYLKQNQRNK